MLTAGGGGLKVAKGLCIRTEGKSRESDENELKSETMYSLMSKKVCVMCFFLPQVHRHKAQAQFPSFNRVARICLLFCPFFLFFFLKMSQCKKQVGWSPPRFDQCPFCVKGYNIVLSCFFYNFLLCQSGWRMMLFLSGNGVDRIYAGKTEQRQS